MVVMLYTYEYCIFTQCSVQISIAKMIIPTEDFRYFTQFLQAIKTATK